VVSSLKDMLRKALSQLPYMPRAMALVWAAAPGWTLVWGVTLLVNGSLPVALVFLTRELVDGLSQALHAGPAHGQLGGLLAWGAGVTAVLLAGELLGALSGWLSVAQGEAV